MAEHTREIRTLVVDDQDLIRSAIAMLLGQAPGIRVVGEAANGEVAVQRALALQPDVILMDIAMPQMDGISATETLTKSLPDAGIILLTTYDTDENIFRGIRAGASAFLLKDAPAQELVSAVKLVAAGEGLVAPRVTKRLIDACRGLLPDGNAHTVSRSESVLSPREYEVYLLAAEGLTNHEIARKLFISEATVKSHMRQVLSKLNLRDRIHVVLHARNGKGPAED